jgi:hypothetical protein
MYETGEDMGAQLFMDGEYIRNVPPPPTLVAASQTWRRGDELSRRFS